MFAKQSAWNYLFFSALLIELFGIFNLSLRTHWRLKGLGKSRFWVLGDGHWEHFNIPHLFVYQAKLAPSAFH